MLQRSPFSYERSQPILYCGEKRYQWMVNTIYRLVIFDMRSLRSITKHLNELAKLWHDKAMITLWLFRSDTFVKSGVKMSATNLSSQHQAWYRRVLHSHVFTTGVWKRLVSFVLPSSHFSPRKKRRKVLRLYAQVGRKAGSNKTISFSATFAWNLWPVSVHACTVIATKTSMDDLGELRHVKILQ